MENVLLLLLAGWVYYLREGVGEGYGESMWGEGGRGA